jgi:hypothetical protein
MALLRVVRLVLVAALVVAQALIPLRYYTAAAPWSAPPSTPPSDPFPMSLMDERAAWRMFSSLRFRTKCLFSPNAGTTRWWRELARICRPDALNIAHNKTAGPLIMTYQFGNETKRWENIRY